MPELYEVTQAPTLVRWEALKKDWGGRGEKMVVVRAWLDDGCVEPYLEIKQGIWFMSPIDAVLFKLTWAGFI